ncbi:MAG: hypothetical protein WCK63_14250 [Betaproteobacteria bacterium]
MKSILSSFIFAIVITGCASVPIVQSPEQLYSTHGYVFVSLPKARQSLSLESLSDKSKIDLIRRTDSEEDGFGVWVPAGEYKLGYWSSFELEGYSSLSVKAGRVTNLGSLVAVPIGGHEQVLLPIKHPDYANKVEAVIRDYQPFLSSKEVIDWRSDGIPKSFETSWLGGGPVISNDVASQGIVVSVLVAIGQEVTRPSMNKQLSEIKSIDEFFRIAKATTPPLTKEPGLDESGNLLFGGDFGQIRVRSPSGEWHALDTGTLNPVTSVEVFRSQIAAGFDDGTIRISSDSGVSWKISASLGQDFLISDIDRVGNTWVVLGERKLTNKFGQKITDQFVVYQAKNDDLRDLKIIKIVDMNTPVYGFPRGESARGYYYFNTGEELLRLDLASMSWASVTPPSAVSAFHISPNSAVIAAYKIQGMFSKLYISTDHGENWIKYDNPPYVIDDIRFENTTAGLAVRMSMGAFTGTFELLQYDRSTDSWNKFAEAPDGCIRILPDATNTARFCVTSGGSILRHTDQKWVTEYSLD